VRGFNLPAIVAINRFPNDTDEELKFLERYCEAQGAAFALSEAFAKGGEGATALAKKVVGVIASNPGPALQTTYAPSSSPLEKITAVAQKVYGAATVELSPKAEEKLARFTQWGYADLPVCIAKTQYSLTDDPKQMGAPTGWTLQITDVVLSAGAGFLVVISGSMMLMPGLPKASRALTIDVDASGEIIGM
jgi:formate--tetrahydrofolate ligase